MGAHPDILKNSILGAHCFSLFVAVFHCVSSFLIVFNNFLPFVIICHRLFAVFHQFSTFFIVFCRFHHFWQFFVTFHCFSPFFAVFIVFHLKIPHNQGQGHKVCFKQSTTVAISMARPESSGDEIKPNTGNLCPNFNFKISPCLVLFHLRKNPAAP